MSRAGHILRRVCRALNLMALGLGEAKPSKDATGRFGGGIGHSRTGQTIATPYAKQIPRKPKCLSPVVSPRTTGAARGLGRSQKQYPAHCHFGARWLFLWQRRWPSGTSARLPRPVQVPGSSMDVARLASPSALHQGPAKCKVSVRRTLLREQRSPTAAWDALT